MQGTRLGVYEIHHLIGVGGMGEVYHARDTKLRRDVAIKILPPSVARDAERLHRFQREAHLLASLNHPHIGAIYGFEEAAGVTALVLELVEGPTLADRIAAGPVPIDETLSIARQMTEALEAAHERGIVHRDLKPANVKVTPDGTVKVLDFGLAKVGPAADLAESPTITAVATREGVIAGTAPYMSPEQARGKDVDKRADIWAFGCVLYELLTGIRAFAGETTTDVLAAVVNREPDWSRLPSATPASVRRLLARCLEKNPKRRLRDIGDARFELDDSAAPGDSTLAASGWHLREIVAWTLVGVLAVAAVTATLAWLRGQRPPEASHRASFHAPSGTVWFDPRRSGKLALSPDRRHVAVGPAGADARLWVSRFDTGETRELQGTEGADYPFWSPDGSEIAFFVKGQLKRIRVDGGKPEVICAVGPNPRGGTWNREGVILVASDANSPIVRVSSRGGTPQPITAFDTARRDTSHSLPRFLPDGRHFLYLAGHRTDRNELVNGAVYVAGLGGSAPKLLLEGTSQTVFASGQLLYVRDRELLSQAFDATTLSTIGKPSVVASAVHRGWNSLEAIFDATDSAIAYVEPVSTPKSRLVWYDRQGIEVGRLGGPDIYRTIELSPDGQRLAVSAGDFDTEDLWIVDLERGTRTRLTSEQAGAWWQRWSPDGRTLYYDTYENRNWDLFKKPINFGHQEPVYNDPNIGEWAEDWSRDGKYFAYTRGSWTGNDNQLWIQPAAANAKPFLLMKGPNYWAQARFSPDARWIAYMSIESGQREVYVTSFPQPAEKWQISQGRGQYPRWRRDGKEIFFSGPEGLMAAPVLGTSPFRAGRPALLVKIASLPESYEVAPDGNRFLVRVPEPEQERDVTVVFHWRGTIE